MKKCFTDLTGRVAVVLGATSGLGRAIAIGLAEAGANVVPSGRRAPQLDEVCAEITKAGAKTIKHPADVGSRGSIDDLRDAVLKEFGRIDILVNAFGRTQRVPSIKMTEVEWATIMDTNLTGMVRACQSFYEPLKASGNGRIINIASLASYRGFHEVMAYNASKAGVLSLTRSLGCEWALDGIKVNAIAPGVFCTELNAHLLNGSDRGKEILTRTPMKRYGKPEEIVGTAVFLASDSASFITGQAIAVDGGFLASGVNS